MSYKGAIHGTSRLLGLLEEVRRTLAGWPRPCPSGPEREELRAWQTTIKETMRSVEEMAAELDRRLWPASRELDLPSQQSGPGAWSLLQVQRVYAMGNPVRIAALETVLAALLDVDPPGRG